MKEVNIDRILFSILIIGFSLVSIYTVIYIGMMNGIIMSVVLGVGVLICVGARQLNKETTLQSTADGSRK